jgi:hypothetical protein
LTEPFVLLPISVEGGEEAAGSAAKARSGFLTRFLRGEAVGADEDGDDGSGWAGLRSEVLPGAAWWPMREEGSGGRDD